MSQAEDWVSWRPSKSNALTMQILAKQALKEGGISKEASSDDGSTRRTDASAQEEC
jgi:hypothetical protein